MAAAGDRGIMRVVLGNSESNRTDAHSIGRQSGTCWRLPGPRSDERHMGIRHAARADGSPPRLLPARPAARVPQRPNNGTRQSATVASAIGHKGPPILATAVTDYQHASGCRNRPRQADDRYTLSNQTAASQSEPLTFRYHRPAAAQ
jgi:hypothetical protein